jgi:hypothetical protein
MVWESQRFWGAEGPLGTDSPVLSPYRRCLALPLPSCLSLLLSGSFYLRLSFSPSHTWPFEPFILTRAVLPTLVASWWRSLPFLRTDTIF